MTTMELKTDGPGKKMSIPGLARKLWNSRTLRVFAVRVLGVAAMFGFEVTMARWLGVAGYGTFNFLLAVAIVFARLVPLGWQNAGTRLISGYASANQFSLLKGVLIQSHVTTVLGLVVAFLGIVGAKYLWPSLAEGIDLFYAIPLISAVALLELHRFLLRGFHAGDLGEALPVLALPALVMAGVWTFGVTTPGNAILLYSICCLPLLVASAMAIWQRVPKSVWQAAADYRGREWALAAIAMMVGSLSDEVTSRISIIMLGFLGNDHETGLYQAAARLALMNVFMLRILTPVAAPKISVLYHEGKLTELRSTYRRLSLMAMLGALPFFLLFFVAGEYVLSWFGPSFSGAGLALKILSVGYLVSAAAGPCATSLMMIGRERIYGMLAVVNLLLSAAATFLLAKYYGSVGAAAGTALMMVVANATYVAIFFYSTKPRAIPQ